MRRQRDRGTPLLLGLALALLACAAIIFTYPWVESIHRSGTVARPDTPYNPPLTTATAWCIDLAPYQDESQLSQPMQDDGALGDRLPDDGVYSLQVRFPARGVHFWRVVACDDPDVAFPDAPAWVWASDAGQEIVLTFDTNQYQQDSSDRLLPQSFIVNALDRLPPLHLYGSVNYWRELDEETRFQELNVGQYRLVYQVPKSGSHSVVITFMDENAKHHGFMGDGRSESWKMFKFETQRASETVVFELDANTGRLAVFYDVPPLLTWMADGDRFVPLALLLGGSGLLLSFLGLLRYWVLRRAHLYAEVGCPNCGEDSLVRIPRTWGLRFASLTGIDFGRYMCRECVWRGARLVGGEVELSPSRSVPIFLPFAAPILLLLLTGAVTFGLQTFVWNGSPPAGNAEVTAGEFATVGELIGRVWEDFPQFTRGVVERFGGLVEELRRLLASSMASLIMMGALEPAKGEMFVE